MKLLHILAAVMLACTVFMTSCGGPENVYVPDTDTAAVDETVPEETESETETETIKSPGNFTNYKKLNVSEENAPYYDAASGLFVIQFTDGNVRYHAEDDCAIGLSVDGEAMSMPGTIDMEAHPEFVNGDYYTGVSIKPSSSIDAGQYTVTVTFDVYLVTFPCNIG